MTSNRVVLIVGQKRMGKTTLAFSLLGDERYLFLDPKGQLKQNHLDESVTRTETLPVVRLNEFFNGKLHHLGLHMPRHLYRNVFAMLASMVDEGKHLPFWVVIDETQFFADSHKMDENLEELVAVGGQAELNLMFIVRESAEIHKFMRSQSDDIISFRQTEPESLKWSAKLKAGAADELPKLKRFEYVYLRKLED